MAGEVLMDSSHAHDTSKTLPANNLVRQVPLSEYEDAGISLAEAFKDDQLARYFVETADRCHWSDQDKWKLHVYIMQCITYTHCMKGIVTTAGPDYASVALWMPPNASMDNLLTFFRSGAWRLIYKLSRIGRKRFFSNTFPVLHQTKATVLGERNSSSYYLVYIGTKPSARGKGYARQLIEHMGDRADREGRPCYLESTSTKNLGLYRRCGYETERQIFIGNESDGGVPLDIMIREPRDCVPNNDIQAAAGSEEVAGV